MYKKYEYHTTVQPHLYSQDVVSNLIDELDCQYYYDKQEAVYDVYFEKKSELDLFKNVCLKIIGKIEDVDDSYLKHHWLFN